MPYITRSRREHLAAGDSPDTAGELNYEVTRLAALYYRHHGANYAAINDVIGALEGAKLEFYRRVAAPYEDGKIKENGDVYP